VTAGPRVLVWNEHFHERTNAAVRELYPDGMHAVLADAVREHLPGADVSTAVQDDPGHGIGEERLAVTDVLVWWGHLKQHEVGNEAAERVRRQVLGGMGLVVLHSSHLSKPFQLLMGTSCNLRWREADDRELLWTVAPGHPLVRGIPSPLVLERHEMYSEVFDIPPPDELVLISSFTGGEVFRSGCCFRRGAGRIAYLSPGHETYPVYHEPHVRRLVANAVGWAAPAERGGVPDESPWSPAGWWESAAT
jgi:trehalose utilization protein